MKPKTSKDKFTEAQFENLEITLVSDESQIEKMHSLWTQVYSEQFPIGSVWTLKSLLEMKQLKIYSLLDSEEPFAFIILNPIDSSNSLNLKTSEFEIIALGILKNESGQSKMRYFFQNVESELKKQGQIRLFLECHCANKKALGFYKRMGFDLIGERKNYYRDGASAWVMTKSF